MGDTYRAPRGASLRVLDIDRLDDKEKAALIVAGFDCGEVAVDAVRAEMRRLRAALPPCRYDLKDLENASPV